VILTIGHSTRPIEEFLAILRTHEVEQLVDVRAFPTSRRHPQFNRESLAHTLADAGIEYLHMPELGGRRHARPDSINTAWKNESFRGYADYMQTSAFSAALDTLIAAAERRRTAIMCAEAVPWQCHRSLISDALTARANQVEHILNAGSRKRHAITAFAHVEGANVTYPGLF
jgi:uncharacterized protein (DUF488 family)